MLEARPAVQERATRLERLERETFDIAIIGGGITGAGIARDAALRGLAVALIEKGDFASGTSGRSSRLVHGGLRYLRHRQISLVREALRERGLLLRLAPHLVHPIPFVLPVYRDTRPGPLVLRAGLTGYELLAGTLRIGRHRALSRKALLDEEPALRGEGLRSGLRYFDAITNDARLTLSVIQSAVREGAAALNYVEAVGLEQSGGRVTGVHYSDVTGGGAGMIRAQAVISAAGPWTDRVRALAGGAAVLRPTKGIHIVVPESRLATNAVVAFRADGRDVFAIPHGRYTYIGTTDTDYRADPAAAAADRADVDYLLAAANATFHGDLSEADVVATWAGVRPLMREEGAPSDVPRDYDILDGPPGLYTICGGKLTTFRSMAEHLLDHVIEREGGHFKRTGRCRTGREPLPGGATTDFRRYRGEAVGALITAWGIAPEMAARLVDVYGADHVRVLGHAAHEPESLEPLSPGATVSEAEAVYAVREEMAMTLEDFLHRRCDLMLFRDDAGRELARGAARVMARELGWSAHKTRRQLAAYEEAAQRVTAFRPQSEKPSAEASS